jgi:hypothetical protein
LVARKRRRHRPVQTVFSSFGNTPYEEEEEVLFEKHSLEKMEVSDFQAF